MSNGTVVLAYSRCFPACLRPCLIRVKDAKGVEGVKSSFVRDFSIDGISTRAVSE